MADHRPERGLKRGELAKRTGCHLESIRYYEKAGLMPEPARTDAGHRIYDRDEERRLRFILRARELGFTIEELKGLLKLVDGDGPSCGEVYDMAQSHIASIRSKIADLKKLEKTLSETSLRCVRGDAPECPIIDALYERAS
ncbi:MAG: MerR family transcriptional regulator [Pseudomonadota bacterium]